VLDAHQGDIGTNVRAKIAAGALPTERAQKVWVGYGNGKTCDACDLAVVSTDVEYETEISTFRALRFHQACFDVWHQERARHLRA
jgi:hypothetical protein